MIVAKRFFLLAMMSFIVNAGIVNSTVVTDSLTLPTWQMPTAVDSIPFVLDATTKKYKIWAEGTGERYFFTELLPALFERTLVLAGKDIQGELLWIFIGERGGFTITVKKQQVELVQRFYDSPAFNNIAGGTAPRYPEWKAPAVTIPYSGDLQSLTVTLDYKLGLALSLNGRQRVHQSCWLDVSRHQLRLMGSGKMKCTLLKPQAEPVTIVVDPGKRHQTMLGFGGIATPTAFAQLSPEGKQRWWQLVCEYNLLIQREYPNGQRLNPTMDNWDRLADATPHYYGDNFPMVKSAILPIAKRCAGLVAASGLNSGPCRPGSAMMCKNMPTRPQRHGPVGSDQQ